MRALGELNADTLGAREVARQERAILAAARAWVAALRAVSAAEAGDVDNEQWYATSQTLDAAERALCAAVDGTPEAHA